jgi:hypothetical protein
VESSISLRQPQHIARVSRKSHSEFHAFCLNHQRLAFSLPIPATVSPDFQTTGGKSCRWSDESHPLITLYFSIVKLQYNLRFEFITNNLSKNTDVVVSSPYLPVNIDQRQRHFQAHQQVQVSTFDCNIPVKIYGSPSGSDRGRPHTFSVQ